MHGIEFPHAQPISPPLPFESIDIVVRIEFLSYPQAEIWVAEYYRFGGRHVGFHTSGLVAQHSC